MIYEEFNALMALCAEQAEKRRVTFDLIERTAKFFREIKRARLQREISSEEGLEMLEALHDALPVHHAKPARKLPQPSPEVAAHQAEVFEELAALGKDLAELLQSEEDLISNKEVAKSKAATRYRRLQKKIGKRGWVRS